MKLKLGLLHRLFIAIAVGVAIGFVSPDWIIRTLNCFRDTFGQFIKFIVPFIILGLVTPAIIDTGKSAGRLLLMTITLAWVSTVVFGYFAYGVSIAVFPKIITGALGDATAAKAFPAYFSLQIPPIMIALYMALDGMGTACNLTGDGAIALIVDRLKGNEKSAKCASCPTQMR